MIFLGWGWWRHGLVLDCHQAQAYQITQARELRAGLLGGVRDQWLRDVDDLFLGDETRMQALCRDEELSVVIGDVTRTYELNIGTKRPQDDLRRGGVLAMERNTPQAHEHPEPERTGARHGCPSLGVPDER